MTFYAVGAVVTDSRLGTVTVLEVYDATAHMDASYLVLTAGGEVVHTALAEVATSPTPPATPAPDAAAPPAEQEQ